MSELTNNWTFQMAAMLAIVAAVTVGFWIAEDAQAGLLAGGWVLAFVLLVHFGRRHSDALNVMGGVGDERTRVLSTRALAFVGSVMTVVLPGWWLVTLAQGEPNDTLAALCVVSAVAYVGGAFWFARRG